MSATAFQFRELPQQFLLDSRMDDSIQLRQLFRVVKDDCRQAAAVDALIGIKNRVAKSRNDFVVSSLPRLHHLMAYPIRLNHREILLAEHCRHRGFAAGDSSGQSVAQHFSVSAPLPLAAICRIAGEASRLSRYCSSAW